MAQRDRNRGSRIWDHVLSRCSNPGTRYPNPEVANRILTPVLCLLIAGTAVAQHDPQRNATQGIASGDFEKVAEELAKAEKKRSGDTFRAAENWRTRVLP